MIMHAGSPEPELVYARKGEIEGLHAEIKRLRAALNKLVTTLTAVENSPSFQGIWGFLHTHGYKYQGPDWRDALADARLAVAAHEQEGNAK